MEPAVLAAALALGKERATQPLRYVLASLLVTAAVTGVQSGDSARSVESRARRPNILIIVTDDQRVDTLRGVMPKTLSWFEKAGTFYSSTFATTPVCCPSRASILTGRYAHNHGVRTNRDAEQVDQKTTLQYYLHENGYTTGIYGKYFNRWDLEIPPPYWDRWSVISAFNSDRYYYDAEWNDQGKIKAVGEYSTTYIARKAARFVRARESQDSTPWFLYVAPLAPHYPYIPEPRYADAKLPRFAAHPAMLERDYSDKPKYVRRNGPDRSESFERGKQARINQLRSLMSVDQLVDRLFRTLAETGEAANTFAVFVSDNGYLWGEHALNGKGFPYTASIRTPLFVRWPGRVPAGRVDSRVAANIDIAPTVLEAAGVTPTHLVDGRSLLQPSRRGRILVEAWRRGMRTPTWASIRAPSYQYTELYDENEAVAFREYYDLTKDPAQLVNLLHDGDVSNNPDVAALTSRLAAARTCRGRSCW